MIALALGLLPFVTRNALAAERRVALVIGNGAYANVQRLNNPANDARLVAETLRSIGFDVEEKEDINLRGMNTALRNFQRKAADADAALFYYAGHGIQNSGINYLLPTDANIEDDLDLRQNSLSVDEVRKALNASLGTQILILDACRDNPFAQTLSRLAGLSRSLNDSRGLAPVKAERGMFVAYATQAADTAKDGLGSNSPFSASLAKRIREPNVEIREVFRRITEDVQAQYPKQTPEFSASAARQFFFNWQDDGADIWSSVKADFAESKLEDFIKRYPDSIYAVEARSRLEFVRGWSQRNEPGRASQSLAPPGAIVASAEASFLPATSGEKRIPVPIIGPAPSPIGPGPEVSKTEAPVFRKEAALTTDMPVSPPVSAQVKGEELCTQEKEEIRRLTGQGKTDEIASRARSLTCDDARDLADTAVRKATAQRQRACARAQKDQQGIAADNIAALRTFTGDDLCDAVKAAAAARIAAYEMRQARRREDAIKIETACASDRDRFAAVSRDAGPKLVSGLKALKSEITCADMRSEISAALKAAESAVAAAEKATEEAVKRAKADAAEAVVVSAKTEMRRIGCYGGEIDSTMTKTTKDAVKRYIASRGLSNVDQAIDGTLVERLKADTSSECALPVTVEKPTEESKPAKQAETKRKAKVVIQEERAPPPARRRVARPEPYYAPPVRRAANPVIRTPRQTFSQPAAPAFSNSAASRPVIGVGN